jgi:hypothetical protein
MRNKRRTLHGHTLLMKILALLQVSRAVEFTDRRLPKVLPVLLSLKGMRKHGQEDVIDEMVKPSVDAFVYALQKKVALAAAQGLVQQEGSGEYVCSFLEESGWTITPEFRDAVTQVFDLQRP